MVVVKELPVDLSGTVILLFLDVVCADAGQPQLPTTAAGLSSISLPFIPPHRSKDPVAKRSRLPWMSRGGVV
jgi:hypothetical protein